MKPAPRLIDARLIAESAIFQATALKRDAAEADAQRYRNTLVHLRGEHCDDGNGWCAGDHAAPLVPFPCEVRDLIDESLRPASVPTMETAS